jgi:predicted metal-binding protein
MREVIDAYQRAVLVHCKANVSPGAIVCRLEREAFLNGYYKALGLGAGPCRLCETCKRSHCDHPDEARPSMEACGIDVYATVRANGFPIEVLKDQSCEKNCYGLLLLD